MVLGSSLCCFILLWDTLRFDFCFLFWRCPFFEDHIKRKEMVVCTGKNYKDQRENTRHNRLWIFHTMPSKIGVQAVYELSTENILTTQVPWLDLGLFLIVLAMVNLFLLFSWSNPCFFLDPIYSQLEVSYPFGWLMFCCWMTWSEPLCNSLEI